MFDTKYSYQILANFIMYFEYQKDNLKDSMRGFCKLPFKQKVGTFQVFHSDFCEKVYYVV